jgi:exopolysaccharide biosynthesis polyprenyl glycosylphosphotransferase
MLATADIAAVALVLALATSIWGRGDSAQRFAWGLLTLPVWVVLFKAYGLYDRDAKRVSHATVDDVPWLFHSLTIGTIGLWLYFRALPVRPLSLSEAVTFFLLAFVVVFVARAAARSFAGSLLRPEQVLFLGGGPMAPILIDKIRAHPEYRLEVVGFVDASGVDSSWLDATLARLGSVAELAAVCTRFQIDRVVVVAPAVDESVLADLIRQTKDLDVKISILPHIVDVLGPAVEVDDVEGITLLGVMPPALTRSSQLLKRSLDVLVSFLLLVALSPLLLVVAGAIRITSSGRVLFSQARVGRGGRHFKIYKFRTMVADAEAQLEELRGKSTHEAWLLLDHDPRITRLGQFLRHASLDELPQLWNVLKGDMSLVGPRPMPIDVDERISGWGRRRLDLTPGITGLWQVLGRTNIPFEEMVKLDYLYVMNWSLWQDVRLLIHTLPAVVRRRGVN